MSKNIKVLGKLGLGTCNNRNEALLKDCLFAAYEQKYDFIDTAWYYGNEAKIGMAINEIYKNLDSVKRKNFVFLPIQSKVSYKQYKGGVNKALKACTTKLTKLSHLQVYFLSSAGLDIRPTLRAWKQLVVCQRTNRVNKIGLFNFDKDLISALKNFNDLFPDYCQYELSVNNMRHDRIKFCNDNNIKIQAYGVMGRYEKNASNPVLIKMAQKYNCTVAQLLIAFILNQGIDAIVSSSNVDHIIENAKAKDIILSDEDLKKLMKLNEYDNKHLENYESNTGKIDLEELEQKGDF